jgi:hypothetical protein
MFSQFFVAPLQVHQQHGACREYLRVPWRTTSAGSTASLQEAAALMPNWSLKLSTNGMPPGPSRQYGVYFCRLGPGVIPLVPA